MSFGEIYPGLLTPENGRESSITSQNAKPKNRNISETINRIKWKLEDLVLTNDYTSFYHYLRQIQHGRRPSSSTSSSAISW